MAVFGYQERGPELQEVPTMAITIDELQALAESGTRITVGRALELLGLDGPGIDTALPQEWANECYKRTGNWPNGQIVFDFRTSTFGTPTALTRDGQNMIDRMARQF